jgi:hypothetical protein
MNDSNIQFFAVGSKNVVNLNIFFSQCTDVTMFIGKCCQFTRA